MRHTLYSPNDFAIALIDLMFDEPDNWLQKAEDLVEDSGVSRLNDVSVIMCGMQRLHAHPQGRELLFSLADTLMTSEGELTGVMATEGFLWLNHSTMIGKEILDWLAEHKQLHTRHDMGEHGTSDAAALLVASWRENYLLQRGGDPGWSREWTATFLERGKEDSETLDLCLKRAASYHVASPDYNTGLILGLMDAGARWQSCVDHPDITPAAWAVMEQHASWKRDHLTEMVQPNERQGEERRSKRGM